MKIYGGMEVWLHYSKLKMKATDCSGNDLPDCMVSYPTRELEQTEGFI
jgi:hypothetical protein